MHVSFSFFFTTSIQMIKISYSVITLQEYHKVHFLYCEFVLHFILQTETGWPFFLLQRCYQVFKTFIQILHLAGTFHPFLQLYGLYDIILHQSK